MDALFSSKFGDSYWELRKALNDHLMLYYKQPLEIDICKVKQTDTSIDILGDPIHNCPRFATPEHPEGYVTTVYGKEIKLILNDTLYLFYIRHSITSVTIVAYKADGIIIDDPEIE